MRVILIEKLVLWRP